MGESRSRKKGVYPCRSQPVGKRVLASACLGVFRAASSMREKGR